MRSLTSFMAALGIAITLVPSTASAQLNGLYTVDSGLPTGGGHFNNLVDAAAALSTQGISGPVQFVVNATATPYAGFAIPAPITGSSATNTVTFIPLGLPPVVSGPAAGYVQTIHLGGTSTTALGPAYIIIDGFDVTGAPSGAAIIAAGCDSITIRNCRAHDSGSGICFVATTNSVIEDNEVYNAGSNPGTPGSTAYAGSISSYYNSHGCTIQRNTVRDGSGNGIFLGSSGSTTAPMNNVMVNNMVWNTPGSGTYPGGIAIRRSPGSVIANNSVWMPAGSTYGGIHHMADSSPAEISNNVIKHDGPGPCFRFESSSVIPAAIFDYNLYDAAANAALGAVGSAPVTTLPAWQALASPNLSGKEINTVAGPAGFLSSADLHITPGSLAFNTGSAVAQVSVDIDLETRPIAGTPDRGADETPASGLFAGFSASPQSGSAPLSVSFIDSSYTSDPGGIQSWAWDFQNDGTDDAFVQNPMWTYPCPGSYSVKLTVTDATNPAATLVRTGMITVTQFQFALATTGGGVGDLTITPVPTTCGSASGAISGWTLASLTTTFPVGTGPIAGIVLDPVTWTILQTPAAPGNPLHFIVAPSSYPDNGNAVYPAGTFSSLSGVSMDGVMIFLNGNGSIAHVSNVARVTF